MQVCECDASVVYVLRGATGIDLLDSRASSRSVDRSGHVPKLDSGSAAIATRFITYLIRYVMICRVR